MQAEPTAVAVVNVQKVFNSLKEKQDIEAELKQRAQSLQSNEKEKRQKIQQMKSNLDVLKPGTSEYQQQEQKLERAVVDLKAWAQYKQQKMKRTRGVKMESLYRKTTDTAGNVAEDNGFDLVLYDEGSADLNYQSSKQLSTMIQMRKVLWSNDKLNITDQVIQRMNNQYQAGN
jgi:Skp family chaperone for outer membrane proteins